MTYELAKRLKDAGFPLNIATTGGEYFQDGEPRQRYLYPTLEELIEACGESFSELVKYSDRWLARRELQDEWGRMEFIGTSPTEAVAHLWLAINKK